MIEMIPVHDRVDLWLKLHKGNVFRGQAPVTHPLGIHFWLEHGEGVLCQPCADAMEPEITATLTQDGLVVLVHLPTEDMGNQSEMPAYASGLKNDLIHNQPIYKAQIANYGVSID